MALYGVSLKESQKVPIPGDYPVYLSSGPHYPEYFGKNAMLPIWSPPPPKEYLDDVVKRQKWLDEQQKETDSKS